MIDAVQLAIRRGMRMARRQRQTELEGKERRKRDQKFKNNLHNNCSICGAARKLPPKMMKCHQFADVADSFERFLMRYRPSVQQFQGEADGLCLVLPLDFLELLEYDMKLGNYLSAQILHEEVLRFSNDLFCRMLNDNQRKYTSERNSVCVEQMRVWFRPIRIRWQDRCGDKKCGHRVFRKLNAKRKRNSCDICNQELEEGPPIVERIQLCYVSDTDINSLEVINREFCVVLKDDLCNRVCLGEEIFIIGCQNENIFSEIETTKDYSAIDFVHFFALNIEKSQLVSDEKERIPKSINSNPLNSIVDTLHLFPGLKIYTFNFLEYLKLAVLMSSVQKYHGRDLSLSAKPINIIIGSFTTDPIISEIFYLGLKFHERSSVITSNLSPGSILNINGYRIHTANKLHLSYDSICFIPDLQAFKKKSMDYLEQVMSSKEHNGQEREDFFSSSRPTIWATIDHESERPKIYMGVSATLFRSFHLCYDFVREPNGLCELDRYKIQNMGHKKASLEVNLCREFIEYSSSFEVRLGLDAMRYLKHFYLAWRKTSSTRIGPEVLENLITLAQASAKIRLISTATELDALIAIMIVLHCLAHNGDEDARALYRPSLVKRKSASSEGGCDLCTSEQLAKEIEMMRLSLNRVLSLVSPSPTPV